LVLELLENGPQARNFEDRLGEGLAALHRFGTPGFGLDHDNFIGSLPQRNLPHARWSDFYWAERLEPQLSRAVAAGQASARLRSGLERLSARLPELVGPSEPPARLHGDLWGGNLHADAQGVPCLIDPAVYGGHREVDLAMMRLFGGFGERVFRAYEAAYPLAPGHAERVELYQLYPLLVHVNLFGGSYVNSVERSLARYV
jgi:fructosamine-3-kinase